MSLEQELTRYERILKTGDGDMVEAFQGLLSLKGTCSEVGCARYEGHPPTGHVTGWREGVLPLSTFLDYRVTGLHIIPGSLQPWVGIWERSFWRVTNQALRGVDQFKGWEGADPFVPWYGTEEDFQKLVEERERVDSEG